MFGERKTPQYNLLHVHLTAIHFSIFHLTFNYEDPSWKLKKKRIGHKKANIKILQIIII